MEYAEFAPVAGLRPYLRCIWTLRAPAGGGIERVLPDGCPELILNRADPFVGLGPRGERNVQPLAMAVGQIARYLEIEPSGVVDLIGIRFEPAGMHALLDLPMHELVGSRVDLRHLDRPLRDAFVDAAAQGLLPLQTMLLERLAGRRSAAALAASRLIAGGGQASLDHLGLPARTLERHFRREVGLSPKRMSRIVRFHAVVGVLDRGARPDWTAVALDAGYYDQAHLIRDFRQFSGITPGAYLREQYALADLLAGVSDSSNP